MLRRRRPERHWRTLAPAKRPATAKRSATAKRPATALAGEARTPPSSVRRGHARRLPRCPHRPRPAQPVPASCPRPMPACALRRDDRLRPPGGQGGLSSCRPSGRQLHGGQPDSADHPMPSGGMFGWPARCVLCPRRDGDEASALGLGISGQRNVSVTVCHCLLASSAWGASYASHCLQAHRMQTGQKELT